MSFGGGNDYIREIWVAEELKKLPAGYKILDAGAGQLRYKKYCSHLKYISQDFNQYDGKGNGQGLQIGSWDGSKIDIVSDIASIPLESNSFDAVLCIEVLEHIPHPIDALKELSRLLKHGGTLILTAPFSSVTHYAPFHFYSGFNKYFFDKYLKEFGFKDIKMISQGSFFEMVAQEIGRVGTVSSRYCNKQITTDQNIKLKNAISVLEELSKCDKESKELMCFGFRIVAIKE